MDSKLVRIYHRGRLIKTHVRQPKGGRATEPRDYPAGTPVAGRSHDERPFSSHGLSRSAPTPDPEPFEHDDYTPCPGL